MSVETFWPDGILVWEDDDQERYCGSHWDPFLDNPARDIRNPSRDYFRVGIYENIWRYLLGAA